MKIVKYILFIGGLASIMACGGTKVTEKAKPTVDNKTVVNENKKVVASKEIKKENNGSSESKSQKQITKKITRKRIVRSDSTYAILFYDKQGNLSGKYDIWENNPFELTDFEKYDITPGHHPMRYDVPELTKTQLKGKIPEELYNSLQRGVHIGRLDIFVNFAYEIENGKNYTPILYQLNAMEGYDEEYEVPASFGIINILDNKGNVWKQVRVPNSSGHTPAVTQDGKYLAYVRVTPTKKTGGCFDVYDLNREKVVFTKCVKRGFKLSDIYLSTNYTIGLSISDFRNIKKKEIYIVSSKTGYIYFKKFYPRYGNYEVYDFGIVKNKKHNKKDTLFFQTEFHSIKL